jgi:hypothetical protein
MQVFGILCNTVFQRYLIEYNIGIEIANDAYSNKNTDKNGTFAT